jgi:hypothetical protein
MREQVQNTNQATEINSRASNKLWQALNRKIWLPKGVYTALPFLYIGLGIYAVGAALFLRHWSWIVPYFLILGIVCLHAGMLVATMRWRNRRNKGSQPNRSRTKGVHRPTVR